MSFVLANVSLVVCECACLFVWLLFDRVHVCAYKYNIRINIIYINIMCVCVNKFVDDGRVCLSIVCVPV